MRVLAVSNMYPPHHLGGYELALQGAVAHLRGQGATVRVLTTDLRLPEAEPDDEADVHRDMRWYWKDHEWPRMSLWGRLRMERHNAATLSRHLNAFRPDVVTWWAMGGMSLSLIRRVGRQGLPAAAFVHDDWLLYGPEVDAWVRLVTRRPWLRPLARVAGGAAPGFDPAVVDRWVFVSKTTRDRAFEWGWTLPDTEVAPSGIDPSYLDRRAAERPWGWRLLYVGRLDERKGILTAADALALLPAEATLSVVGGGDERTLDELRKRQRDPAIGDRLRIEPARPRSALPDLYAESDAVLFPVDWDEPWGLVPLEAMAIGRPVIATGRGGSGEYLVHEQNALLFGPGRHDELAQAVLRLAADAPLRHKLREAGLALAPRYTDRELHARVEAVVRALAGRPN